MKFKIVLILAALSLVCLPSFAAVQNVKIGGDLTILGLLRNDFDLNSETLDKYQDDLYQDNRSYLASIIRVRLDADLTENVVATLRLINERDWDQEGVNSTDIDLDLAYVTVKELLSSPVTLTLGRQELHFGNDLIVGDPNSAGVTSGITGETNAFEAADLSLRKGFDAVRLTADLSEYAPVTVDAIYAKIDETGSAAASQRPGTYRNDDIDLYGLNARYTFDVYNALAEAYYFTKHSGSSVGTATTRSLKAEYIQNLGLRGSVDPIEDLNLQLEYAYQFGDYVGGTVGNTTHTPGDRSAWAIQAIGKYKLPVLTQFSPALEASYTYLSGEDETETGGDFEGWDPMYENQAGGSIFNALFNNSAYQAVALKAALKPIEDVTLSVNNLYAWLTADYNDGSPLPATPTYADTLNVRGGNKALGLETDVALSYDYTEDVQFGLNTGFFLPGPAFDTAARGGDYESGNNDNAWEAIASMKVVF